ncbi:phenmedipham hydrolase-like [Haemaphysalis longicornis]
MSVRFPRPLPGDGTGIFGRALRGGMVVMSPNVRLGVLGFMHPKQGLPEHDVANEDAIAAVNWAIANAAAFGANSDEVALVGHGSGAYMLARAAARLNISSSRAILEGPLPRSVFPVNRRQEDAWARSVIRRRALVE